MNPRLVTTGTANGNNIDVDVSYLTPTPSAVVVTLNTPYELADPMPPGYPTIPSLTGVSPVGEFPGKTFPAGTVLGLLEPEADALIAAGATTEFPGFSSASVVHGTNPTLVIAVGAVLDTASTPAASAFVVTDNGTALTVSTVTVGASSVSLGLTGTVSLGDAVTFSYTPPGTNPVQNTTGTPLAAIVSAPVTVS